MVIDINEMYRMMMRMMTTMMMMIMIRMMMNHQMMQPRIILGVGNEGSGHL